ncbi:MAG: OmpH family outer membrane protein [Flavobacteriaceae bacterium]|nr:OmpH family outer membrane protein [Flavobacteriaceae bacterium]
MKLLKIIFLFICVSTAAQQTKVGTVDIDFILSKMPEMETVQKQVEEYSNSLNTQLTQKLDNYKAMVADYQSNEVSFTIAQKKTKQDSIFALENDITKYRQNAGTLISLKQEEFLNPLYQKVGVSLEKIAEAQGYTQVLLRDNSVVYVDNRFDLTIAILNDMGIEVKREE